VGDAFFEVEAGERSGDLLDRGGRVVGEDLAAVDAGGGTEVDDAVGAFHQHVVVLDDEERVALPAQRPERFDQAVVVAGVQTDRGFVEHVEDAGKIRAELGGEANALGFAAGERFGRSVEREVVEADVGEETQALLDLGHDVLGDQPAAGIELEAAQGGHELLRSEVQEGGQGDRLAAFQRQLHGPRDSVQTFAGTGGTELAVGGRIVGIEMAERIGDLGGHFLLLVGLQHPVVDVPMAAAGRAPALRRIEGKLFRIEFGEGLSGLDVGARRREPAEDAIVRREEEAGAFAQLERKG